MKKNNLNDSILELKKHLRHKKDEKFMNKVDNRLNELKSNFSKKILEVVPSIPSDFLNESEILKADLIGRLNTILADFNEKFDLLERLTSVSNTLNQEKINLTQEQTNKNIKIVEDTLKKNLEENLGELRKDLLNRLANLGGGSMNRQILIGGIDVLTRYTDINLIGSITAVNNDAKRRVDITFSGSGGSAFQLPLTGTIGNDTFTWATAPNAIVVDEQVLIKVSQNGDVNWKGTTTTVLSVKPTQSIFAIA